MKRPFSILISLLIVLISFHSCQDHTASGPTFSVTAMDSLLKSPEDGRLLLFISKEDRPDPLYQTGGSYNTQQVFGIDVEQWAEDSQVIGSGIFGYPLADLNDLPAGEYYIQALFHKYETFNLSTGHTVKLPMNRGAGQNMKRAPGNLYSKAVKVKINPQKKQLINLVLTEVNPPLEQPEDTKYIKHIKMQSELLTEFWGRPVYLGAHILLPEGFDSHPEARYPLCIFHGHYPADFGGFRTEPPEGYNEAGANKVSEMQDYNIVRQQQANAAIATRCFGTWTSFRKLTGPGSC